MDGSTELAANLFIITQTEDILDKKNINDEANACNTHYNVEKAVRNAIKEVENDFKINLLNNK